MLLVIMLRKLCIVMLCVLSSVDVLLSVLIVDVSVKFVVIFVMFVCCGSELKC